MRDVGGMGEDIFKYWCSSVGMVANPSAQDMKGWDFFVEFPVEREKCLPLDMQPAPIECKVQVKSTDKREGQVPVAVSNLKYLVQAQVPAFLLFVEFDNKNIAQRAFLVDVNRSIIEKTLKRIRELESKGLGGKLHKRNISIKYSEAHRLTSLDGECLKRKILDYIPDGIEKYVQNKLSHIETVGFDDGAAVFKFSLKGDDEINKFIDATIGLDSDIAVSDFKGYHSRFGIVSDSPFFDDNGLLKIVDVGPSYETEISFRKDRYSIDIPFEANVYTSSFGKGLERVRFETDYFDMVLNPENGKVNFKFDIDPRRMRIPVKVGQ